MIRRNICVGLTTASDWQATDLQRGGVLVLRLNHWTGLGQKRLWLWSLADAALLRTREFGSRDD